MIMNESRDNTTAQYTNQKINKTNWMHKWIEVYNLFACTCAANSQLLLVLLLLFNQGSWSKKRELKQENVSVFCYLMNSLNFWVSGARGLYNIKTISLSSNPIMKIVLDRHGERLIHLPWICVLIMVFFHNNISCSNGIVLICLFFALYL